jgi:hypothetical protein
MPRGDSQKRDRGSFRLPSTLADFDRSSELGLSQTYKASQRRNVLSGLETSLHEPLSQARRDRSLQLFFRQFGDVRHLY